MQTQLSSWTQRRFPIDPTTHADQVHGMQRQVHHCWFFPRLGDLDGDGALEVVYLRGAVHHLAYRSTGELLWEWRDQDPSPNPVRSDSLMPIGDFDGDGRCEIACLRRLDGCLRLCLLDGISGTVKLMSPEPLDISPTAGCDTHVSLIPANLDGPDAPLGFLLHADYRFVMAFGHDLKPRWQRAIPELGHTTMAADLDGDGRDEFYTGTRLITADGHEIWSRPDLLEGTGETHSDSNPIADIDGEPRLILAPGARILDRHGSVQRSFAHIGFNEVQSVRVLRGERGAVLAFTDLPANGGPLAWRGIPIRDVRSITTLVEADGKVVARIPGMHTPAVADWNGDGDDELVYLSPNGATLRIIDRTGHELASIPIQQRVYISDIAVGPIDRDSRGDHLLLHAWNEDFTAAEAIILSSPQAKGKLRRRGRFELACQTPY